MNKENILILSFLVIMLFVGIIQWGEYLIKKQYIIELFKNRVINSDSTNHNVDMPLTTSKSCQNMCGPNNRCSLTGEQCSSDIDCFGCNPETKQFAHEVRTIGNDIRGQNDAGKLSTQQTPTYSTLTTDIGTKAKLIKPTNTHVPEYFKGVNMWRSVFDDGMGLYDKRYTPNASNITPNYPERKSMTGEFTDNGPLAANDFL